MNRRIQRINSLLKEVLSDVIRLEVKNPHLPHLLSVTHVDVTSDLQHAKVYISVIGTVEAQKKAIEVLNSAAGFIAVQASKQVVMRYFPELRFILDDTIEQQIHMETLMEKLQKEREGRE